MQVNLTLGSLRGVLQPYAVVFNLLVSAPLTADEIRTSSSGAMTWMGERFKWVSVVEAR